MFDLPPDLPRLRTLRTWHALVVHELDQAIAAAEKREAARQRATEDRNRQPRPGHTDPISRAEALQLITDGVEACPFCNPDTALGL